MEPEYWKRAIIKLKKEDAILKSVIERNQKNILKSRKDPFGTLLKSIVGQQISVKAAESIHNKLLKLLQADVSPNMLLSIDKQALRETGLSRQKISYLKNISKSFKNKSFNVSTLKKMNDEDAIIYITKLKGLGVWSAQMFLMFNLNRPDIYPTKDIGLIRAISKNYNKKYPPPKSFLDRLSKLHKGYRSVFTWYMWRSIDPVDVEY